MLQAPAQHALVFHGQQPDGQIPRRPYLCVHANQIDHLPPQSEDVTVVKDVMCVQGRHAGALP